MIKMPRGTKDILPQDSGKWQYIERIAREVCDAFNFREIRVPTFEHTELFARGVGDTTDVVQKEMYTFPDKDDRSLTLRPEGTAGVMRAFIEHGLYGGLLPLKLYYLISCFRYEKPQAGRLREFHQFGVELLGSRDASADAEVISLAGGFFSRLGVKNLKLMINSLGCRECRKGHSEALLEYYTKHIDDLCDTCKERLSKNPMRISDCKNPSCGDIARGAPSILDYICGECADHFEDTKRHLDEMEISYEVDPTIVRGLDYYSKTVFEFISSDIGAQATVCGGGRYDYLSGELGGVDCPGLGFALGLERLIMVMEEQGCSFGESANPDIFVASMGSGAGIFASGFCKKLRREGISAERDLSQKSLKAQMKYADKLGVRWSVVLGDDEIRKGLAVFKNMDTGDKKELSLSDLDGIKSMIQTI